MAYPLFLLKKVFAAAVLMPLLLAAGIFCLFEEYAVLNPAWIRRYVAKVLDSKGIPSKDIRDILVKRSSGGTANMVRRVEVSLAGDDKPLKLIFKKYLLFGSVLTYLAIFLGPYPRFKVSPACRQKTESEALASFSKLGIPVPGAYNVDPASGISLFRFIEGERMDVFLSECVTKGEGRGIGPVLHDYGRSLATIHKSGWSLIDGNPFNFKYDRASRLTYFTDLELATRSDFRGWDIANTINIVRRYVPKDMLPSAEEEFLKGYSTVGRAEEFRPEVEAYLAKLRGFDLLRKMVPNINFE